MKISDHDCFLISHCRGILRSFECTSLKYRSDAGISPSHIGLFARAFQVGTSRHAEETGHRRNEVNLYSRNGPAANHSFSLNTCTPSGRYWKAIKTKRCPARHRFWVLRKVAIDIVGMVAFAYGRQSIGDMITVKALKKKN